MQGEGRMGHKLVNVFWRWRTGKEFHSPWNYNQCFAPLDGDISVVDPVEYVRAIEKFRRSDDCGLAGDAVPGPYTLYGLSVTAIGEKDLIPTSDPRRSQFLDEAARRWTWAYREACDIDPASADAWPETKAIVKRILARLRAVQKDATWSVFSSGGKRCGIHLECPSL